MVSYVSVVNRTKKEVPNNFVKEISELFLHSFTRDGKGESNGVFSSTIVFVTDGKMQRFNKTYRNKNVTTDVLSFCARGENIPVNSIDNGIEGGKELGDILVSLEEVKRNAIRFGVTMEEELARVVVHGLLHLLGYGHKGTLDEDGCEMLRLQEQFIDQLLKDGFIE